MAMPADGDDRSRPSHFVPRTREGRIAALAFLGLLALAQPPLVFVLGNRIEPWLLGMPFLYAYLLVIYIAMIAVLLWVGRRGL
jgi:hypothetical protein